MQSTLWCTWWSSKYVNLILSTEARHWVWHSDQEKPSRALNGVMTLCFLASFLLQAVKQTIKIGGIKPTCILAVLGGKKREDANNSWLFRFQVYHAHSEVVQCPHHWHRLHLIRGDCLHVCALCLLVFGVLMLFWSATRVIVSRGYVASELIWLKLALELASGQSWWCRRSSEVRLYICNSKTFLGGDKIYEQIQ